MSRIKVMIYKCDICKKKVDHEIRLRRIRLPYLTRYSEEYTSYGMRDQLTKEDYDLVDCCDDCSKKMAKMLADNFGFYDRNKDKIEITYKE